MVKVNGKKVTREEFKILIQTLQEIGKELYSNVERVSKKESRKR